MIRLGLGRNVFFLFRFQIADVHFLILYIETLIFDLKSHCI